MNSIPSGELASILARHSQEPGALLPIFHAIQDLCGYVPRDCLPDIAQALNLSRAEVHGVLTYYHHFKTEPAGRHTVQICRAEACQAMGAEALLIHAQGRLGCRVRGGRGTANSAGDIELEPVFCLGLCASSPAVAIDERPYARITPEKLDVLLGKLGS